MSSDGKAILDGWIPRSTHVMEGGLGLVEGRRVWRLDRTGPRSVSANEGGMR